MADVAGQEGYEETANVEDADLVILQHLHIRERASEKIFSELGQAARPEGRARAPGPPDHPGRGGCVAQAEGRGDPLVVSRRSILSSDHKTTTACRQLLRDRPRGAARRSTREFRGSKTSSTILPASEPQAIRCSRPDRFVTVQEGCDKFCSFCVVPYTRAANLRR